MGFPDGVLTGTLTLDLRDSVEGAERLNGTAYITPTVPNMRFGDGQNIVLRQRKRRSSSFISIVARPRKLRSAASNCYAATTATTWARGGVALATTSQPGPLPGRSTKHAVWIASARTRKPPHTVGAFLIPEGVLVEIPTVKPDNDLTRPLSEEHADALMAEMTRRENAQIEKEATENGN